MTAQPGRRGIASRGWTCSSSTRLRDCASCGPARGSASVVVNSHGYRSPEIPCKSRRGTVRFAFLGDSLTFGSWEGGNETTWPFHAVEAIRHAAIAGSHATTSMRRCPGNGMRHVRCPVSASRLRNSSRTSSRSRPGVGGNCAAWARRRIGYTGVHYAIEPGRPKVAVARPRREEPRHLAAPGSGACPIAESSCSSRTSLTELSKDFRRELSDLVSECQEAVGGRRPADPGVEDPARSGATAADLAAGSRLYYQPYMSMSALLDVKDEFNRVCREIAAQKGAVLVELADALPATREYFEDSSHCTPAANRVIGESSGGRLGESRRSRHVLAGGRLAKLRRRRPRFG